MLSKEEFEDIKRAIIIRKSKKNRNIAKSGVKHEKPQTTTSI
jgi:hypothetical protein